MSFLVYQVFLFFFLSRNAFKIWKCGWKKWSLWTWSVFNGLSAAAYCPAGTAHTVTTKQNPLTFNKYLFMYSMLYTCTIHWHTGVSVNSCELFLCWKHKTVLLLLQSDAWWLWGSPFFLINSFLSPERSSTIKKSHLGNTLEKQTCSTYNNTLLKVQLLVLTVRLFPCKHKMLNETLFRLNVKGCNELKAPLSEIFDIKTGSKDCKMRYSVRS